MACYIDFELNNRKLKINKENPDDILMWKTHGRYKLKNPKWNQLKIQTDKDGYKLINIKLKQYRLHRVNYYAHNPTWDIHDSSQDNFIDHENKDKTNNHISNLRKATPNQNQHNTLLSTSNTSGVKGVSWYKEQQQWRGQIRNNNKQKHIGYFKNIEDAASAIRKAREKLHGEYANHGV